MGLSLQEFPNTLHNDISSFVNIKMNIMLNYVNFEEALIFPSTNDLPTFLIVH